MEKVSHQGSLMEGFIYITRAVKTYLATVHLRRVRARLL